MDEVMTAVDAGSLIGGNRALYGPPPSNNPYKEKRWDSKRMISSAGMPSSHSATVTALVVAIGLEEGAGAPAFAIAVVLACFVMYDASGFMLVDKPRKKG